MENGQGDEEAFYAAIEKADGNCHQLDGQIHELVESYFVSIHDQLIDVVEE